MGSAWIVFIVSLNLVFFTFVSSQTPPACPQDLGACEQELTDAFLGGKANPNGKCCQQFSGLSDTAAASCFCKILKANSSRIPAGVSYNYVTNVFLKYCARKTNVYNCV